MIILATILSGLSLLMCALFLVKPSAKLLLLLFLPLLAEALSPIGAIMGVVGAILGWVYGAPWAVLMGVLGGISMITYFWIST